MKKTVLIMMIGLLMAGCASNTVKTTTTTINKQGVTFITETESSEEQANFNAQMNYNTALLTTPVFKAACVDAESKAIPCQGLIVEYFGEKKPLVIRQPTNINDNINTALGVVDRALPWAAGAYAADRLLRYGANQIPAGNINNSVTTTTSTTHTGDRNTAGQDYADNNGTVGGAGGVNNPSSTATPTVVTQPTPAQIPAAGVAVQTGVDPVTGAPIYGVIP
ncbi:MAG: hypothetical protein R8M38_04400 [Mariprofundaceae bacterium]